MEKLIVRDFRSFENTEIQLSRDITIFVGENNGGKSNAIDAIRLATSPAGGRREIYSESSDVRFGSELKKFEIETWFTEMSPAQQGRFISAVSDESLEQAVFGYVFEKEKRRPSLWAGQFKGPAEPGCHEMRLRFRVRSCEFVAIASLSGHQLRFHKRSVDGSAKCNARYTGDSADVVWAVVFDILESEKKALDDAEGVSTKGNGYKDSRVSLTVLTGEQIEGVITYLAQSIVEGLPAYTWYKEFVTNGAAEHGLPTEYVAASIDPVLAIQDPKPENEKKERSKLRF